MRGGASSVVGSLRRRSLSGFASSFDAKVARHWTPERLRWLQGDNDYPLAPQKPGVAPLLRVMGLLSADAQLGTEKLRKYKRAPIEYFRENYSRAASRSADALISNALLSGNSTTCSSR
jgi:hypothetical protein